MKVTDGVGAQQKSNIATVTVNPKLWVTIAPASAIMEVGQSQLFTSHLIGGTSPYAYQWYLNDSVVSGADGSTWNFTLSSEGPCRVSVKVTDGVGAQQKSNTAPVNTHNVAITDVWSYKTTVGQNFSAHIGVNVTDLGSYPEIFIVTAYADTTSIAAQNITLSALGSTIMTLTWNTTGFVKGNYTISAYAQPVLGETDTTDNTHVNGKALVTIKGDVVPEFGTVDIYDLISVATSFGTSSGEPNFKSNADINSDNTIDIYDIIIVATHYGETDP